MDQEGDPDGHEDHFPADCGHQVPDLVDPSSLDEEEAQHHREGGNASPRRRHVELPGDELHSCDAAIDRAGSDRHDDDEREPADEQVLGQEERRNPDERHVETKGSFFSSSFFMHSKRK